MKDYRDFTGNPAEQFEFELIREDYPVNLQADVQEGQAVVIITLRMDGVSIGQPFLTDEARDFARRILEFADAADGLAAK